MSAGIDSILIISAVVHGAFLLGLLVAALFAVVKLRILGSWLLLTGTLLRWLSFGWYVLNHAIAVLTDSQEVSIAIQLGVGGMGDLIVVAGLILVVLHAASLQSRAKSLEHLPADGQHHEP